MMLTVDTLNAWFRQFNASYFDGELPVPRIVVNKARTRLGTMSCKKVRRLFRWVLSDFTIRISTYYDCTERQYQETLLHEMIHYYIVYKNIADTSSHGRVFRQIMQRLNHDYGWHITISSKSRELKPTEAVQRRNAVYVVLALEMRDGSRMLSVVSPRSARKLNALASTVSDIVSHRWYVSTDSYFRDFPKVRTLRARRVANAVYEDKTAAMQPLVLK